ncbi:MAG: amidohydrolase family protein [Gemmatimonadetes bacterium]|nr:amidohydrolase family protein [Gemmatimonadota bacterium]
MSCRLALFLLFATPAGVAAQIAPPRNLIAITHVSVVDGTTPSPRHDHTVIVDGNRVAALGPAATTPVPAGAHLLDGRGKFLIPGLWDMHVHTAIPGGQSVLALYVANGVTSVRDMAGDWAQITAWRREISAGRLLGPRIVAAGPYIEGGDVPIPHLLVRAPEDAGPAVDSLKRLGVDFVKLHSQLPRNVYFAAARAARERALPLAGHVPRSITPREASDSGVQSLEHMLQIPTPCTPAESLALVPRFPVQGVLGRCTSEDLTPLFTHLARNGTWVVPTLVAQYEVAHWPKRDLPGDLFAPYLPDTLRRYVAQIFPMADSVPDDADAVGHALWEKRVALVGVMRAAGVGVLPGTDAPLRNSPPGFGLHEELATFARGGFSPFDALRAATLEPARFLGLLDSLGTIEPGKIADLVLLDADPLTDIRNVRRIVAVVANGRLLDAEARQALLRDLVAAAGR